MSRIEVQYATIPLSGTVSGDLSVLGPYLTGLWVPVVTSCALYLQGSFDTTSANFVRLRSSDGGSDWSATIGPGSRAVSLQDTGYPFPYLRVETSVAQAAVRSLAIVTKIL